MQMEREREREMRRVLAVAHAALGRTCHVTRAKHKRKQPRHRRSRRARQDLHPVDARSLWARLSRASERDAFTLGASLESGNRERERKDREGEREKKREKERERHSHSLWARLSRARKLAREKENRARVRKIE